MYAAMNSSPPLRDNLMIPTALWSRLAPDIKRAVMETRKKLHQESADPSSTRTPKPSTPSSTVPRQYPNITKVNQVQLQEEDVRTLNLMQSHDQLSMSGLLYEDSSDTSESYSSDVHVHMARSLVVTDRRIMDRMINTLQSSTPVAYVDSGADTCIAALCLVLGQGKIAIDSM